jgi:hypothetical protein
MQETAEMLAELRDSLVQLSGCLKDFLFASEGAIDAATLTEVHRVLEVAKSSSRCDAKR